MHCSPDETTINRSPATPRAKKPRELNIQQCDGFGSECDFVLDAKDGTSPSRTRGDCAPKMEADFGDVELVCYGGLPQASATQKKVVFIKDATFVLKLAQKVDGQIISETREYALSDLLPDEDARNTLKKPSEKGYENIVIEARNTFGDFNFKVEDWLSISSKTTLAAARESILRTGEAPVSRIEFNAEEFKQYLTSLRGCDYDDYARQAASAYFKISMYCALERIQSQSTQTFPTCILGVALDCMAAGTRTSDNSDYDRNVSLFRSFENDTFRVYQYALSDPSADLFKVYDDYFQDQCDVYEILGDNFDKRHLDHMNLFTVAFGTTPNI